MAKRSKGPFTEAHIPELVKQLGFADEEIKSLKAALAKRHNGDPSIPMTPYDYGYEQGVADTKARLTTLEKAMQSLESAAYDYAKDSVLFAAPEEVERRRLECLNAVRAYQAAQKE